MASGTRKKKPADANKSKPTAAKKGRAQKTRNFGGKSPNENDCLTLRRLARLGLCTLDDECINRVRETLVEQYPEMKRSRPRAKKTGGSKRGTYKLRELKPKCLVSDTRVKPLRTLLRMLYGDKYMPIINQAPSRNAADRTLAQILTTHWGLEQPMPVSEIAGLFGREDNHRYSAGSPIAKYPWPPEELELLGCQGNEKETERHVDQEQKVSGLSCAAQLPKMEIEEAIKVKAEQICIPLSQQQPADDECYGQEYKTVLLQDHADRGDKQDKEEIKEEGENKEDSGCCPTDEDAMIIGKYNSSCYDYFTAALWREEQQFVRFHRTQSQCHQQMECQLDPDSQKSHLPNLCNGERMKDEPMYEDKFDFDYSGEAEFINYDDCSSSFVVEESLQMLMESLCNSRGYIKHEPLDEADFDNRS